MAEDDECQMENYGCQVAGGDFRLEARGCAEGQNSEPVREECSGPVVGYDSNRVIDDSSNDKIGILSHESEHAAGQPGQGDGAGVCLPDDVTTPQKAPNKANLGSTQSKVPQHVESENSEPRPRDQSQSWAGGQVVQGAGGDRVETIVPAGKDGGKARGRGGFPLDTC